MSEIVFNTPTSIQSGPVPPSDLQTQVESLQTTLASLNQQVIILQETLHERDQEIADLRAKLADQPIVAGSKASPCEAKVKKTDNTLTIVGVLIRLYQFLFPPGKDAPASINTE